MNGLQAVSTARVIESNLKDHFKEHKSDSDQDHEYDFQTENQSRVPEQQTGQFLNTIA